MESNSSVKKQINISTVDGILHALGDPERAVQMATLKALIDKPEKVLAIIDRDGADMLSMLYDLIKSTENPTRKVYVCSLLSLDKGAYIDFAKEEFAFTTDNDVLLLAAQRLASLSEKDRIEFFAPYIMDDSHQTKTRIAANLLAYNKNMDINLAIKVAIMSDHKVSIPPLNETNLDGWLAELEGAYPFKTRRLLISSGQSSFQFLLDNWDKLPDSVKIWSLGEIAKRDASKHLKLIENILLNEKDTKILTASFDVLMKIDPKLINYDVVTPYRDHKEPELRAFAIQLEQTPQNWVSILKYEVSDVVRMAVITHMGKDAAYCSQIADLLEDGNWRIRALATNALVSLSPESLPFIRKQLHHEKDEVKIAAAKAIQQLGL